MPGEELRRCLASRPIYGVAVALGVFGGFGVLVAGRVGGAGVLGGPVGVLVAVATTLGVLVGVGVALGDGDGLGAFVGSCPWVGGAVAGAWVTSSVGVGVGVTPPLLSSRLASQTAAAMPNPSATQTTATASKTAEALGPEFGGGGLRRTRAVGCRRGICGGLPGGAATGAIGPVGCNGIRWSALPNAAAFGKRSCGERASARASTASSSAEAPRAKVRNRGAGVASRWPMDAPADAPENGGRPATSSNTVRPNE